MGRQSPLLGAHSLPYHHSRPRTGPRFNISMRTVCLCLVAAWVMVAGAWYIHRSRANTHRRMAYVHEPVLISYAYYEKDPIQVGEGGGCWARAVAVAVADSCFSGRAALAAALTAVVAVAGEEQQEWQQQQGLQLQEQKLPCCTAPTLPHVMSATSHHPTHSKLAAATRQHLTEGAARHMRGGCSCQHADGNLHVAATPGACAVAVRSCTKQVPGTAGCCCWEQAQLLASSRVP
jgi:hypothetical protein